MLVISVSRVLGCNLGVLWVQVLAWWAEGHRYRCHQWLLASKTGSSVSCIVGRLVAVFPSVGLIHGWATWFTVMVSAVDGLIMTLAVSCAA